MAEDMRKHRRLSKGVGLQYGGGDNMKVIKKSKKIKTRLIVLYPAHSVRRWSSQNLENKTRIGSSLSKTTQEF